MSNTIIRWNPFRELATMQSAMDRLFEDTWRDVRPSMLSSNLPIDVHENENEYIIIANLPGVEADQIDVSMHDGTLTINVELAQPETQNGTRVLMQERFFGKLTRRLTLPQQVDMDKAEASYRDGVLRLSLPKSAEAKPRQIPVKTTHMIEGK